jgi:hypothetical protein
VQKQHFPGEDQTGIQKSILVLIQKLLLHELIHLLYHCLLILCYQLEAQVKPEVKFELKRLKAALEALDRVKPGFTDVRSFSFSSCPSARLSDSASRFWSPRQS